MYIVTGGAGFIGSAMVWKLNSLGINDIIVVDNLASSDKWKNLVNRRFTDYLHRDEFEGYLDENTFPWRVDGIFHLGACSSTTERNVEFLMNNNLKYTKKVCARAVEHGIRFVNASSAATYGDGTLGFFDSQETAKKLKPLNPYGWSKQLFDLHAMYTGVIDRIASVKFFNVYGPNEYHKGDMKSVVCKVVPEVLAGKPVRLFKSDRPEYGDGDSTRDFVYVKDVVNVLWWLMEHPESNGIFNLGSGRERSWNDLAKAVFAALGKPVNIEYFDMPASLKGKYQYKTEAEMSWLAREGCDVKFHTLEEGVADYVKNYMTQSDIYLEQF